LEHISRWARFKEWASKITVAEAGMLLLTLAIAGSSIAYTKYAKRQWKVMGNQLREMQKSNEMERRRAEDQEEAVVRLHTYGLAVGDYVEHVNAVNSGKFKARNVEGHVDVSLNDASNIAHKIRDLGNVDISTTELRGTDGSVVQETNLSLTANDWQQLADTNLVIIETGHIRYENGFGRIIDEPYCEGWWFFRTPSDKNNPVQGRGSDCGQIPVNVAGVKKNPPH